MRPVIPVHLVVPVGIDDPRRPSGGNAYDRRLRHGLRARGWEVHEHAAPGTWPRPGPESVSHLRSRVAAVPDGALLLVDGLVGSAAAEALLPHARRLRLVLLVHLPLGVDGTAGDRAAERAVLAGAAAVVTTSRWTRRWLLDAYHLPGDRVHVAEPGVAPAPRAEGGRAGTALLTVAAVTPVKGHDVLAGALAGLTDLPWTWTCVGGLDRDPAYVAALRDRVRAARLGDRVHLAGPRTGAALDATYAAADLLVVPSRTETYGMVVLEALARGLPVVASDAGGLPDALGTGADGGRPGRLVLPGDPDALAGALRAWLTDAERRDRWRARARDRVAELPDWATTVDRVARVLDGVAA